MYRIVGSDNREYGPVDADQVCRWIAEHRAVAETKVQPVGSTEWKTLAELEEFRDALRSASSAPPPPPSPTPPLPPDALADAQADLLAREVAARRPQVDIGACLQRGFDLVRNNPLLTIGGTFVVAVIMGGLAHFPIVGWLAGIIVSGPLMGGLMFAFLKRIRGQEATVNDLFAGFGPAFGQLVLVDVVFAVLVSLGLMVFVLPGIYLAVAWMFAMPLVVDRRMEFWPAMEASRKVANPMWWTLFGLWVVAIIVAAAGLLLLLVGALVTAPIALAALLYAYEDVFGNASAAATVAGQ